MKTQADTRQKTIKELTSEVLQNLPFAGVRV